MTGTPIGHDFCIGMRRDRDAAADCVQDVFCAAADRLHQLRDPDKLRPWLYAIARNECLRTIRARGRERVFDEVPEVESAEAGPDTMAARSELASLVAEAAGGLSDRDRLVLELAYRLGLDGPELAEALGVSTTNAKKMAQRLRETIERSLGAVDAGTDGAARYDQSTGDTSSAGDDDTAAAELQAPRPTVFRPPNGGVKPPPPSTSAPVIH